MGHRTEMYRMRPIFELPEKLDLPTCMYPMRNIVSFDINQPRSDNNEILDNIKDKKPLPELSALEARWDRVLNQLNDLVNEVSSIKEQINNIKASDCQTSPSMIDKKTLEKLKSFEGGVINANPSRPPHSLFLINKLCGNLISFSCHTHSNLTSLKDELKSICDSSSERGQNGLKMRLVWKSGKTDAELIVNPLNQISVRGEVNILRSLARGGLGFLGYPSNDIARTVRTDSILDICHRLQYAESSKELSSLLRNLNGKLGKKSYFGDENLDVSDIAAWSVLKQLDNASDLTPNMKKWFERMEEMYSS